MSYIRLIVLTSLTMLAFASNSLLARVALEDTTIGGQPVAAGSTLTASLWSANRDSREFPKADEFAVDDNRGGVQIAFGGGAHHCLGAALARAELQESLVALASRMRCPKLQPGDEWLPPIGINGPTRLPIAFERR